MPAVAGMDSNHNMTAGSQIKLHMSGNELNLAKHRLRSQSTQEMFMLITCHHVNYCFYYLMSYCFKVVSATG